MLVTGHQVYRVLPEFSDIGQRLGCETPVEIRAGAVQVFEIEHVVDHFMDDDARHAVVVARLKSLPDRGS